MRVGELARYSGWWAHGVGGGAFASLGIALVGSLLGGPALPKDLIGAFTRTLLHNDPAVACGRCQPPGLSGVTSAGTGGIAAAGQRHRGLYPRTTPPANEDSDRGGAQNPSLPRLLFAGAAALHGRQYR